MMNENFEPAGVKFFSVSRNQECMLCQSGAWSGWILYKHPDGQWVSLRKATDKDMADLHNAAIVDPPPTGDDVR